MLGIRNIRIGLAILLALIALGVGVIVYIATVDEDAKALERVNVARRLALSGNVEAAIRERESVDKFLFKSRYKSDRYFARYVGNRLHLSGYHYKNGRFKEALNALPLDEEVKATKYYYTVRGTRSILEGNYSLRAYADRLSSEILALSESGQISNLASTDDFGLFVLTQAFAFDHIPDSAARDQWFRFFKAIYGEDSLKESVAQLGKKIIGTEDNFIMVDFRQWLVPYSEIK
jgi:hypothetical protein